MTTPTSIGNTPWSSPDAYSDAELVNEHYRLEMAIYTVEEDLLLSDKSRDGSFPVELKLYLKGKGVRTLGRRQVCPARRVLTWINAPIVIVSLGL
jgi:hypothetical protein